MEHRRVCVSIRATLCFIIAASLIHVGFAQVLCTNPLSIGELRVFNSRKCVDIHGNDGQGNVLTASCDGGDDQQVIICNDGTIRNKKRNNCLQPQGTGNTNVVSAPCSPLNGIPARQRWRMGREERVFVDRGGIRQVARKIINMESRKCLDVHGSGGNGNILSWDCSNPGNDQFFYVRSKGKEVRYGRLRNERSNLCLDVDGEDGRGNVKIGNCDNKRDQWFRLYGNGEIINEASRKCLEVEGTSGNGNILMDDCADFTDQMWRVPTAYCNEDYCSFKNKKSGKCLDVSGYDGRGNIGTEVCTGHADQRFKWVSDTWLTPTATWNQIACNQNGGVTQQISNTVSFESTITSTTTIEVSSTIESGVKFLGSSVTTTVSTSLSKAWTSSRSGTAATTLSCENYDNGKEFTGGCMWQLQVETQQVSSGDLLVWTPQIIKCTRNEVTPQCPPFTKCTDDNCEFCTDVL